MSTARLRRLRVQFDPCNPMSWTVTPVTAVTRCGHRSLSGFNQSSSMAIVGVSAALACLDLHAPLLMLFGRWGARCLTVLHLRMLNVA